jgi:apolipoprotein N-acyltransferase
VAATLSRRDGWTVYVRFGDELPLALAGLALIVGWVVAGRRRRLERYS